MEILSNLGRTILSTEIQLNKLNAAISATDVAVSPLPWGLVSGTDFTARHANISSHRSWWTPFIFWTQPGSVIRLANPELTERTLLRVTDLLGREVNPNKVIDKTTLLYIYDDGTVEKRIVIE
jgi:hypothetical protein